MAKQFIELGVQTIQAGKKRLSDSEQWRMSEIWGNLIDSILLNQTPDFEPEDMAIVEKWTGDTIAGPLFEQYIDLMRKIDNLPDDQRRQYESAYDELLTDFDSHVAAILADLSDEDLSTLANGPPAEARKIQKKCEFALAQKIEE